MRLRLIVAAILLCTASFAAKADTVNFTYVDTSTTFGGTVSGSGSFTFAGSPSSISLGNLTSFTFTDTLVDDTDTPSFTYGLGNLTSFAATLSGTTLQTLSLQTGFVNASLPGFFQESFTITSLNTNGATTHSTFDDEIFLTSTGTVTASVIPPAVPEPSSIALLGTGVLGLAGMLRRRFV